MSIEYKVGWVLSKVGWVLSKVGWDGLIVQD